MFVAMRSTWCFSNAKTTLDDHGVRSLWFPGILLPVCVSASVRKRILAIFAFGRCVFFASFSPSFCSFHILSCVRLFVRFYNYIFNACFNLVLVGQFE